MRWITINSSWFIYKLSFYIVCFVNYSFKENLIIDVQNTIEIMGSIYETEERN